MLYATEPEVAPLARLRRFVRIHTASTVPNREVECVRAEVQMDLDPARFGVAYDVHDGFPPDAERRVFHRRGQASRVPRSGDLDFCQCARGAIPGDRLQRGREIVARERRVAHLPHPLARFSQRLLRQALDSDKRGSRNFGLGWKRELCGDELEVYSRESLQEGVVQVLGDADPLGEGDLVLAFQLGLCADMPPSLNEGHRQTTNAPYQQDSEGPEPERLVPRGQDSKGPGGGLDPVAVAVLGADAKAV